MRRLVIAISCSAMLSGCGFGTGAVAVVARGDGGSPAPVAVGQILAPRSATSPATVSFSVVGASSAKLEYGTPGSPGFRPVTLAPGSAPLTGIPSGIVHSVLWDFAADLGGSHFTTGLRLRLIVAGGNTLEVEGIAQGNDSPQVLALAPQPPLAEFGGNTDIGFRVNDSAQDAVTARIEFNDDADNGFPAGSWRLARPAATPAGQPTPEPQMSGLSSGDQAHAFRWDTLLDLPGFEGDVRVRVTTQDDFGGVATLESSTLHIDNNAPPRAVLDGDLLALNPDAGGAIPVPYRLFDDESDPLRVLVQWRRPGEAFPLSNGRDLDQMATAELLDLIDNPERASERNMLQIAAAAVQEPAGRVASMPGLGNAQVRLPELASTAADLLARGIGGGSLEILRPNDIPVPVTWSTNPLDAPVAALPVEDGLSVLVLDQVASGWRLRRLDLETGQVLWPSPVAPQITGTGAPRCLALDPSGSWIFVGTDQNILRLDRTSGSVREAMAHGFVDGPRALAAVGEAVTLATGDNRLSRFDLLRDTRADLFTGLATPFGVALDPLEPNTVFLSEQSANRVTRVDLNHRTRIAVPAQVAAADQGALGSLPFPSPRSLALERGGARLVVWTQFGAAFSLRELDLRTAEGAAPFVHQVVAGLPGTNERASISVGLDHLRIASLGASNALAVGGGVIARRRILADEPGGPANRAYDPARQVVTLAAPFATPPAIGLPWRIRPSESRRSSRAGVSSVFLWDAFAATPGEVIVRVLPMDSDAGTEGVGTGPKNLSEFTDLPSTTPSGSFAFVTTADLNGDARLDLVSVESGRLSVFFQASSGGFPQAPNATLTTGSGPRAAAAADLNGDGRMDLVSVDELGNRLSVFLQSSSGVFPPTATTTLTTGTSPTAVAAADLNGDGRVDLVSADWNSSRLSLFLQSSTGVLPLVPGATLTTGTNPLAVVAADLNGDGRVDLVSADETTNTLSVFLQASTGVLPPTPSATLATGNGPRSVAAADVNGDGRMDLVSVDELSNRLSVFLQSSSGVLPPTATMTLTTGANPIAVAAADLNGDGRVDLVSAANNALFLFCQRPAGGFSPVASATLPIGATPSAVAAADLDGDGRPDLVCADPNSTRLSLFLQETPGVPRLSTLLAVGLVAAVAADADGDGRTDMVLAGNNLTALLQDASGSLASTPTTLVGNTGPTSVAAGDLNGDGRTDLITAELNNDRLLVFPQSPSGVFPQTPSATLTTGSSPTAVVVADLDGDGRMDLVSADRSSNRLSLFLQSSSGAFPQTATTALTTGSTPLAVTAADLNGDGRTDLASADRTSNRLSLFLQSGAGGFSLTPSGTLPVAAGPVSVVATDLNGDGRADLAAACSLTSTISVFLQTSAGAFPSSPTVLGTGSFPVAVVAADLNRDGRSDLLSCDNGIGRLSVFLQSANGSFPQAPTATLTTGGGPRSIAVADLNGDGCPDLACPDSDGGLSVFLGP